MPGAGRHRLHPPDPRRASLRAPQRRHPSRHQAAQRHRRSRGRGQGHGLRHRACRVEPDDGRGSDHRHGAVPLSRAGTRRAGRPDLRPLLDRDRPLRASHRERAVHGRNAGRDRDEAPLPDPGAAVGRAAGDPGGSRPPRRAGAREGACGSLPVGCGDGRRPRDRRARRSSPGGDRRGRHDGPRRRRSGYGRDGGDAGRATRPAAAAVRAEAPPQVALALAPGHRSGSRGAGTRLPALRRRLQPRFRPGRRPVRRRHSRGERAQRHPRARPRAAGPQSRELRRRGGHRLCTDTDRGHGRRAGHGGHDRRLDGQARGDRPERHRPVTRRRGRGARRPPGSTRRSWTSTRIASRER